MSYDAASTMNILKEKKRKKKWVIYEILVTHKSEIDSTDLERMMDSCIIMLDQPGQTVGGV
jgi:hypothetical protein